MIQLNYNHDGDDDQQSVPGLTYNYYQSLISFNISII